MPSNLLVVDVGNTNIVLGIYRGDDLINSWRLATARERTSDEYGILAKQLVAESKTTTFEGAIVSSVVPPLDPVLRAKTLAYSKCMRAHGIADFPDPNGDGVLQIQGTPGSDLAPDNPQFHTADKACKHLLPGGGKGGSTTQGSSEGKS